MIPFLISIPKSGTNMINQAVRCDFTNIPYGSMIYESDPHKFSLSGIRSANLVGVSHISYHPTYEKELLDREAKIIFLYRDPRDLMVSYYFWIKRLGHRGSSIPGLIDDVSDILDSDDPFSLMISFWGTHIRRYIPWMFVPGILPIMYEDIINFPSQSFTKIANFWDNEFGSGNTMLSNVNKSMCPTFRKGIIGDWKNHLTENHVSIIADKFGKELDFLGYDRYKAEVQLSILDKIKLTFRRLYEN